MKRILVLGFIISQIITSCKKDDLSSDCRSRYYYFDSDKITLTEIPNQGCISFYDTVSFDVINKILGQYQELHVLSANPDGKHVNVSIDSEDCQATEKLFTILKSDPRISNCNKFLISKEGYTLGISDIFVCKLKNSISLSQMTELINDSGVEILESETSGNHYIIRADKNSVGDALDMANMFFESGYFEYAEPEFISSFGTY